MSSNVSDWREKYLNSLDERDRLKKQFERRHKLLRRALVRVSLAAEGRDDGLDRELGKLRASANSDGQLTLAVERLEETLLRLEQVDEPPLSGSAGQLDCFLGRTESAGDGSNLNGNGYPDADELLINEGLARELDAILPARGPDSATASLERQFETLFAEDKDRIQGILLEFLDRIEPVECTRQKAKNARARLAGEFSWRELVPTLEDVRDLALQSYLRADEEHKNYLLRMHQQLEGVVARLGGVASSYQKEVAADQELELQLHQQLNSMGKSVQQANKLDTLKQEIDEHLGLIQEALDKRQRSRDEVRASGQLDILTSRLRQVEEEAKTAKQELETQKQKATTDVLTGLPNREAYNQRAHAEWMRKQRDDQALTLAVCDIDKFKAINDKFGHQTGDRVLQVLAKTISQRLRATDFIARYGGEEFVMLLPQTPLQMGWQLMDKIRAAIAEAPFRFKQEPLRVTLSLGLVEVRPEESIEKAFERADKVLYRAKEEGRNRCLKEE
ncbi:MAG: diguanylate cyclase [Gammaproteobacteria bacterium]|nr:diguanylate cyclase [Gammaproteobacteria bacterium]